MSTKNSSKDSPMSGNISEDPKFMQLTDQLKSYCEKNNINILLGAGKTSGDDAYIGFSGGYAHIAMLMVLQARSIDKALSSSLNDENTTPNMKKLVSYVKTLIKLSENLNVSHDLEGLTVDNSSQPIKKEKLN